MQCVAASDHILFSWLPTTISACKPAASSSSEQFLWMLCCLSALTCLCPGGSWAEPACYPSEGRQRWGHCLPVHQQGALHSSALCPSHTSLPQSHLFPISAKPHFSCMGRKPPQVLHVPSALSWLKPAWQDMLKTSFLPWRPPHPAGSPHAGKDTGGSFSPCNRFPSTSSLSYCSCSSC